MDAEGRAVFKQCTKRAGLPQRQFTEAWLVVGRRGGKSRVLALIAVYLACFIDWRPYLSPGERGKILCIATDRRQARVIFRYIEAFIKLTPMIEPLLGRDVAEVFELDKRMVDIEIHTASFRAVRGYTIVAALLDEIAFFRSDDSTNPDYEIIESLRPGMATIPGALLLCASSPYARRGELYKTWKDYFSKEDRDILVWQAETRIMNPAVPQSYIDKQYERNPSSARAEYGAIFRTDVETFVSREVVDACTIPERYELKFSKRYNYKGFTDPSGGSQDSFTLGIAHEEKGQTVLDLTREAIPPFSPEDVTKDFAKVLRKYGLSSVTGDRYAGEWPRESFRKHGIEYILSDRTKSDIYRDLLPLLNSKTVDLLDDLRLRNQLLDLERRVTRGGRDSIDHPPHGRDDVINSAAGAIVNSKGVSSLLMW